jgi:hypothetical protein
VRFGQIEQRPGYRLWIGGPVPPGAGGWTLGTLVIVRARHATSSHLLAHELEHVRQYREQGFARFLARYVTDYLRLRLRGWGHRSAYRRLPAEVSAEWRARRLLHIGCDR